MKGYLASIVVALVVQLCNHMSSCSAHGESPDPGTTNSNYIKTSCNVTTYPKLCCNVLQIYAGKTQMSAKGLAQTALDIALDFTIQTHTTVKGYSGIKALNPVATAAMSDCTEELNAAVQMLQKSKVEFVLVTEGSTSGLHISNVQTWVSAALTNLKTCKGGFVDLNLNGTIEEIIAKKSVRAARLTSNALALTNLCVSPKVPLP